MSNKVPTSKKARVCPALDRTITPAECGSGRGSQIDCPADCPFNPLGTTSYDLYQKLDGTWVGKAMQRVVAALGQERFRERLKEETLPIRNKELELDFAAHNVLYQALFLDRDAEGRTLVETWEAEGLPGLNNDERVMTRHRKHTLPAVLEVQQVLENDCSECLDLLDPAAGSFPVYDRGVAESSARFTVLLSWLTRYPHYARTSGIALQLPPALWETWRQRLAARHEEACRQQPDLDFRRFLARHMVQAGEEAVRLQSEMNKPLEKSLLIHRTEFTLTAPLEEVQAALATAPDFDREPDEATGESEPSNADAEKMLRFVWSPKVPETADQPKEKEKAGEETKPTVRLTDGMLVADALGPEIRDTLKSRLLEVLAGKATHREDTSIDVMEFLQAMRQEQDLVAAAQQQVYGGPGGTSAKPTQPQATQDTQPDGVAEKLRAHYEQLLDRRLESLNGKSPREAARDEAMRPQLLTWGKQHVHTVDRQARDEGHPLNIDWVLEELGLQELK
jgi:hypothetical protein